MTTTIGPMSRYVFCEDIVDANGNTVLSRRVPYRYRERIDNRQHVVKDGDTLHSLAHRYFRGLPRPSGFWWAIADYQPDPITDPTITLEAGRVLQIPATSVLTDIILGERRRREFA